jgi:hypothetical protein
MWIKKILISCGALFIFLALGEYTIRYAFKDITTTGHYSYFSKKWSKTIRLNSLGFREKEIEPKSGSTYRIAVIGDSYTFGQGIEEKDRFTNLLEAELNGRKYGYEVLNFGKAGAETVDEIKILRKVIDHVDPDFVLLQWHINDFEGHDKSRRPKSYPLLPSDKLNKYLRGLSAFYFLANIQWQNIQSIFRSSGSYETYMLQRFGDPELEDSKIASSQLTEFIDLCQKHNIPLGIVLYSEVGVIKGTEYPFGFLYERVVSLSQQKGVVCLDLRADFSPYTKDKRECKKLYVNRLDSHPSPLRNRIAAASIMRKFGPIWLSRDSTPHPKVN